MNTEAELFNAIKRIRQQEGLTQAQLGERLGLKKSTISRIENHDYNLSLKTLFKLVEAFGRHLTFYISGATMQPAM